MKCECNLIIYKEFNNILFTVPFHFLFYIYFYTLVRFLYLILYTHARNTHTHTHTQSDLSKYAGLFYARLKIRKKSYYTKTILF